ncbi:serine/threonine protein kinase [Acidicapsa acidisoli]|uniref:serine/threonine protein kinase n=1 Tax=Acidicapsa acidisoli TaxID=1615681 RepID=UPI0021E0A688|nr:serine/threonine-protein kinase [Acidicapsa acidisoli]
MIAPNLAIQPGDQLDHYQIDSIVATSGMATVFRARDLNTGQQVAIKVPHPEIESDPALYDRFQREEEIGKKIDHPGVMKVFANPDRTQVYMVMEWIEGRLLRQIMNEEKKLPIERAVKLTIRICDALEHIHANGVVHRDLKPENIMVDAEDNIRLIDFGIAGNAGSRRLTFANFSKNMGTPDYISPEQVRGKRGDARSDVYSMGVMLYEMLTGKVPFSGANAFAVMNDRLVNQPVPPRNLEPSITPQLQEILYRALEREPKNRYHSAREFAHDLAHQDEVGVTARVDEANWQKRQSPERRRLLMYAMLAMLPVAIFVLLYLVARHH